MGFWFDRAARKCGFDVQFAVRMPSPLTRFWFRAKLAKGIGDLEPGGLEVDEDMRARAEAWVIV